MQRVQAFEEQAQQNAQAQQQLATRLRDLGE
jgi:hypothetical protein